MNSSVSTRLCSSRSNSSSPAGGRRTSPATDPAQRASSAPPRRGRGAEDGGSADGSKAARQLKRRPRVAVAIADGHQMFRCGFESALRSWPEFNVVAAVADGSVRDVVAQRAPRVLLLDPVSIGEPGQDLVEQLSRHCQIVVVRMEPRPEEVYRLLTAGALGFLGKDCSEQEVRDAILAADRGEARIGETIQPLLADELRLRRAGTREFLTERELEILKLMADGLTAPEIASKLEIGTATVKTHQSNMYARFGVHDAKAAIVRAMRLKLIE